MDLTLPSPLILLLTLLLPPILLFLSTYLTTLSHYHRSLRQTHVPKRPPLIPYSIPFLGSTIPFSNQTVGHFWNSLRQRVSHTQHDAFTMLLAGKRTHLIFSPTGISALFKSRSLSRSALDRKLATNALGMSPSDALKAFPSHGAEHKTKDTSTERLHADHLLSAPSVNLLTSKFISTFTAQLADLTRRADAHEEVNLYATLHPLIFAASTTALFGSALLAQHPDFLSSYRVWEDNLLTLLFGVPRLFAPAAYAARDTCIAQLTSWLEAGRSHDIPPGDDPDWTAHEGARVMRKRHEMYAARGLSVRAQAGWDLVFLAGIISNATPATGWLLLHILDPAAGEFRAKVEEEVRACRGGDGEVDVGRLGGAAWFNAGLDEVLRMYVDLVVVRDVDRETVLGGSVVGRGEQVMAPSWMTHRDPVFFEEPEVFRPERWIERNEEGEVVCKREGLGGKYFPFGGGHYMCPGRVFARQEVLGTVAVLLAGYEIECVGWVDGKGVRVGAEREGFPGIKKGFAGNQVVGIEGDMKVRIKRRELGL